MPQGFQLSEWSMDRSHGASVNRRVLPAGVMGGVDACMRLAVGDESLFNCSIALGLEDETVGWDSAALGVIGLGLGVMGAWLDRLWFMVGVSER